MGVDFGLGGAVLGSARPQLPHPPITDLDQAIEHSIDHEAVADLWPLIETDGHDRLPAVAHRLLSISCGTGDRRRTKSQSLVLMQRRPRQRWREVERREWIRPILP